MGPSISASIQESEVALNFNPDPGFGKGAWEHDGWELKLLIKPAKVRILSYFVWYYVYIHL